MEPNDSWWTRGIIYQIFPLSFQDSDGDGKGDLPGILDRLDYLTWLGVDAVWLSPIHPSPMDDAGYDVADFTGVDPVFGSLSDFERLLEALHENDIRLILDFVPNHTSDEHPWFQEARSARDSPKRDWYIWADPAPDGGPPTNWRSRFGGSAWTYDEATDQYYYHSFLESQPDLNWRNPEVRRALFDVMRFWLEKGVDGFRVDAAAVLAVDALLRDDPPAPEADESTPPPERQERVFTNYRPEVLDWLVEMREVIDEFTDRVLLGEVDTSGDRIADFYGRPERPMIELPLNYVLLEASWDPPSVASAIEEYLDLLPSHAWPNWAMGSHDKTRIASRIGREQARCAAMLLFTLPGTPIFYAGDELGLEDEPIPAEEESDPFAERVPGYGLGRDPERAPMPWNGQENAGFSEGEPWLPVAGNRERQNVAALRSRSDSILHLYRRLIALHHEESALQGKDYETVRARTDGTLVFRRRAEDRSLLVALNLSAEPQSLDFPEIEEGRIRLSTHLDQEGNHVGPNATLRGHEGVIIGPE